MDSLERLIRAAPLPPSLPNNGQGHRRALVHASLATAVGRKGRHLTGTFCLTGDTMEGIIQCLVFLKAFSVSFHSARDKNYRFFFLFPNTNSNRFNALKFAEMEECNISKFIFICGGSNRFNFFFLLLLMKVIIQFTVP